MMNIRFMLETRGRHVCGLRQSPARRIARPMATTMRLCVASFCVRGLRFIAASSSAAKDAQASSMAGAYQNIL
jgi:hypothetical protein